MPSATHPALHRRTVILIAALAVVSSSACGGGSSASGSSSPYRISGQVTSNGQAASGVTVDLTGTATATTTTDAAGNYAFDGLLDGQYTVQPSHAFDAFLPASLDVTVSGGDVTAQDFTVAPTYAITGRIDGCNGLPVTVTLLPAVQPAIQVDGNCGFKFVNVPMGFYDVTPSLTGYTFSPKSAYVVIWDRNETASIKMAPAGTTYTIDNRAGFITNTIEGGDVEYYVWMTNWTGVTATNVTLQDWIEQGTGVRRQASAEKLISCTSTSGEFPPGTRGMLWSYRVSNQAAGTGTLVAGPATHVMEMKVGGNLVSTLRWPITLSNP